MKTITVAPSDEGSILTAENNSSCRKMKKNGTSYLYKGKRVTTHICNSNKKNTLLNTSDTVGLLKGRLAKHYNWPINIARYVSFLLQMGL